MAKQRNSVIPAAISAEKTHNLADTDFLNFPSQGECITLTIPSICFIILGDRSMDTLTDLVFQGLSYPNHNIMNNLILKTIREYIRLAHAYLLAYDRGLDIVAADEWIKRRRSHR